MSESREGNPLPAALLVLVLVGGGWYFLRNYHIRGLDQVSVSAKRAGQANAAYQPEVVNSPEATSTGYRGRPVAANQVANLKVASWALDGLGPTKLSRESTRETLLRVLGQFDLVALQQVAAVERDTVPRLVAMLNESLSTDNVNSGGDFKANPSTASNRDYDFLLGRPTGPSDRPEQFAFLFDTRRISVDRTQTYELADPDNKLTYDPLVAWFRAAEPDPTTAWTFTMVSVRVDLVSAASEAKLLPLMLDSIRNDGRGEDDVLIAGLFQADASYLLPTMGGNTASVAVKRSPTDVFGRHQTSNLLFDRSQTTEFVGRSGAVDFLRLYNLDLAEAESVTPHLPVFGEFTANEVGDF